VARDREALLALLPDLPRWVELRALLLGNRGDVLGFRGAPLAAAVADAAFGSAFVVGEPSFEAIGEALGLAGLSGTLMSAPESAAWVRQAIPELSAERAIIHALGSGAAPQPGSLADVRHLRPDEAETIALPPELRVELRAATVAGTPIAAALADGVPVAFCYAGSVTETLWDVSIDTLEPWRRRGFAARAAGFEIARLRGFGRRPVWGAAESNTASRRLAAKLGFVPVDELWIFATPPSSPVA
jgi:hypothetical protein